MPQHERADCTVRALASAAGITYPEAHAIATAAGRRKGCRFHMEHVVDEAKRRGFMIRKVRFTRRRTLERFLREYPAGRYYVHKVGHAFAVVDGVPSEPWQSPRVLIVEAWEIVTGITRHAVTAPAPGA